VTKKVVGVQAASAASPITIYIVTESVFQWMVIVQI
jgi:hypothetical protein